MMLARLVSRSILVVAFCGGEIPAPAAAPSDLKRQLAPARTAGERRAAATSLQQHEAGWWLVAPDGRRFFSLGMCGVSQGTPQASFDLENPSYGAWQHHATPNAWADATLRRLKSWGMTTVGAWSDFDTLRQSSEQTLHLTPVLHIGSTAGAPWWDMWDPKNIRRMEAVARQQILPLRADPRVLGYYSDNELGWWNATLWKMTLEQPASSGQRQRLVKLLRETYQNDWQKLLEDFEPENAANWSQLRRGGMLYLKSGGRGIHTMRRFLGLLADRYYQLMRDILRQLDSQALFLGDRYQSFFYPEVARAAARYVDVSSSNLNAQWSDGTFLRCYLDTLHRLTGRPVLVSEFYAAAAENRSGNRNTSGIFPVIPTQAERAAAARTTLTALARLPYVVGADWFQYFDEPTHGRDDGENFNFGLVDVHNRPYAEITSVLRGFDAESLRRLPGAPRLDASSGVPPAPDDPFAQFKPTEALRHWDRARGYVPPVSEFPLSDLYVCWKAQALYLGLYSLDVVESAYYRSAAVPKTDRALWTVHLNGRPILSARLGSGREPLHSEPRVRLENSSGVNHNVSNVAAIEVPAGLLGQARLRAGDTLELESTLLTHCGAYRIDWKGRFTLRE
jgi:hypothetical protein